MGIVSIQSQVVTGHVGNSAAVLALQLRGYEVWPIPTVLLSHHPGHGGAQGEALPAALLQRLLDGMAARPCFARCEAVISGYLGSAPAADIITGVLHRSRAAGAAPVYLCDPVLGDDGRSYVSPDIAKEIHRLAAIADILTPNAYELSLLTSAKPSTRAEALLAMRRAQSFGPGIVLLTSFEGRDTPAGALDVMVVDGAAAWLVSVPKRAAKFSGAGDLFAALFLSFWLPARDARAALGQTCATLQEVLLQTVTLAADELALVPARHQILAPVTFLLPEPLA